MNRRQFLAGTCRLTGLVVGASWGLASSSAVTQQDRTPRPTRGPLRVSPRNPRYFCDATGQELLLAGSHTWNNLVDMGRSDPPEAFDFEAYLDFLERYGHNFIRLWTWDSTLSSFLFSNSFIGLQTK